MFDQHILGDGKRSVQKMMGQERDQEFAIWGVLLHQSQHLDARSGFKY
jgi:hypothetical protein